MPEARLLFLVRPWPRGGQPRGGWVPPGHFLDRGRHHGQPAAVEQVDDQGLRLRAGQQPPRERRLLPGPY